MQTMAATTNSSRPAARRRPGVAAEHPAYPWWVLSVTSLGMFLATVNSGTLLIALPDVERALGTSLLTLVWVILAYMVASTVLVLPAGRLADQLGRRRLFVAGMAVFTIASLGAGFADSGTALIVWRIVQGIGGAFVFANAGALVTDAFPREKLGLAMGTNTMVAAVGLVIGPVLGGWLVGFGWGWVFWFNVPFGVIGDCLGRAGAARDRAPRGRRAPRRPRQPPLPGGADRPGARALGRRPRRLERADGRGRAGGRRGLPAAVRGGRAARPGADARPVALPHPRLLGQRGGGLPQRPRALRADVPVRLLLPGAPAGRPDHGRHQAHPARRRDARRLADRRRGGPTATARGAPPSPGCS